MKVTHWTPIYSVTKEWTGYEYLCDRHKKAFEARGFKCVEIGLRPGSLAPNECTHCCVERFEKEQAAEYF